MVVSNLQMGTFNIDQKLIFHFKSPCNPYWVPEFSIYRKPIRSITFHAKKNWSFDSRRPTCRIPNALPINTGSLDKEFKFEPNFDDYVKAMESARSGRDKHLGKSVDGFQDNESKDDSSRTDGAHSSDSICGKSDNGIRGETSGGGWGLVEGIMGTSGSESVPKGSYVVLGGENGVGLRRTSSKFGERNNKDHPEKRNYEDRYYGQFESSTRENEKKQLRRNGTMKRDVVDGVEMGISRCGGSSDKTNPNVSAGRFGVYKRESSKFYGSKADETQSRPEVDRSIWDIGSGRRLIYRRRHEGILKDNEAGITGRGVNHMELEKDIIDHDASQWRTSLKGSVNGVTEEYRDQERFKWQREGLKTEQVQRRLNEAPQRLWRRTEKSDAYLTSTGLSLATVDDFDADYNDRAAFKSFEVFSDVRNKRRVSRIELEDRIQKLAKWLNGTDINMPQWQFSKMIHSAKIRFTDHSILRVIQILGDLGNWQRVLQIVEWLQSHQRFESYKSRIQSMGELRSTPQELSSYPDLAAYHCIAVILGQAGYMKELFDVTDCMRSIPKKKFKLGVLQKWDPRLEPDLVVYNAVLNACVQRQQWEGAFWVLQQLKQQCIQPSSTTYGLVMEVMLVCEKYNLVHEFFKKVEKSSIPSALNYKVLVNTLWKEGKTDEAILVVQDMERRGIVGSASLYYDLSRCLCSAGRCEEALSQIDKLCKVAKKPLVVTYTGLIQTCINFGSIENAEYIFNEMQKFCSPNVVTCNIMLKAYLEHGMLEKAIDLFQKILDGIHHISHKSNCSDRAIPDKFTFNIMLEACFSEKRWNDFENAYVNMLSCGYHFDSRRHLRMVFEASQAGKGHVLEVTWNHLIRAGRTPPPLLVKEMFCIKLAEDEPSAAIACIGSHQTRELHHFSTKSWLNLLKDNAHRFRKETLVSLVEENENERQMDLKEGILLE
ncbi:Pentatricopeptide repeat-containing protein [Acorus gramineus]|uniref:Pentatricopeptide repeat-containing protein n=1 Tax=Acorus gramineus TaxID=55184 RepID=A0AAV9BVU5_ACOGR|nr:Pentatricopeptide repeat-containing protein [Acorus gramineus]